MNFYLFQIDPKIIILSLSTFLPFILNWTEKYNREIDNFCALFYRYINKSELDKSENYSAWLNALSNQKEKIKFILKIKIEDNEPLLLSGRGGRENDFLRGYQTKLKIFSRDLLVLNILKYCIPVFIIYLAFF